MDMPSVATSVTSQMPPLVLSSRRLSESWIAALAADGFLTRTTARASCVRPPLTTVVGGVGSHPRTNWAKFWAVVTALSRHC